MTKLLYLQHPKLFETHANIVKIANDSKGFYIVLDATIFYPQGGGQPADQGKVFASSSVYKIYDVRGVDGEIRHYVNKVDVNDCKVKIVIDQELRSVNCRYHTAGHLIAAVASNISPNVKAIKGHQFPGEAYIEFDGILENELNFKEMLDIEIANQINNNATVETKEIDPLDAAILLKNSSYLMPTDKALRTCCIQGFAPTPCGGTHVSCLKEIGAIVTNCKSKKGKTKICYMVDDL